ncbi:MAG: YkgJ family cysteine cluster protein [Pyrinomonadaceae bacterium]
METDEMLSGDLKLNVGGENFELNLTIPAAPVKPQRMLPVFQKLTNNIVARGIERATEDGKAISCKAGCGACCRQPLLISEAEAFNLADLVETMPAERRLRIKQRFREGRERFEELDWFNRFDSISERARSARSDELGREFVALLTEYIEQRVPCPFLEAESCSIYEDRPLICREYLVTSPAENCRDPRPDNTEKLPISGRASTAFASLTKTENSGSPSSLLLIRLLEFAETHTDKFEERIGPAWADDFFRLLTHRAEPGLPESSKTVDVK